MQFLEMQFFSYLKVNNPLKKTRLFCVFSPNIHIIVATWHINIVAFCMIKCMAFIQMKPILGHQGNLRHKQDFDVNNSYLHFLLSSKVQIK